MASNLAQSLLERMELIETKQKAIAQFLLDGITPINELSSQEERESAAKKREELRRVLELKLPTL